MTMGSMWLVPGSSHGLHSIPSSIVPGAMPSPASQHPSRELGEEPAGLLRSTYLTIRPLPAANPRGDRRRSLRPLFPTGRANLSSGICHSRLSFPWGAGARARLTGLKSPACAVAKLVGGATLTGAWADVVPFWGALGLWGVSRAADAARPGRKDRAYIRTYLLTYVSMYLTTFWGKLEIEVVEEIAPW